MSVEGAAEPPATAEPQRVRLIFGALLLVLLLASLDQTIVSTALPTIVGDLGGINHLSWVVTAYLLASTIAGPLYGKLGDLYGRKILLQIAIVLFLIGSILCGLAQNMTELIAFRALQGLGGGGLIVTTMAVVGDIIPPRERGRYQGFFGAVFGVSTVVGPLLGGFFVDNLSWRWIFYVNVPIGVIAFAVIGVAFRSRAVQVQHAIDYLGAVVLAGALSAVVLFTSLGGTTYDWTSPQILGLIVVGAVLLVLFPIVEARAAEPILPLELFRNRTFTMTSIIGFVVGLALFGSVTFLPLYLQVVKGHTPTESGLLLLPLMGGVLVTSIVSGNLISKTGHYRGFPIAGTALMVLALFMLASIGVDTSVWAVGAFMLVLGLGLGMVMQVLVLAAQNAVEYRLLGVATSGSTLFRQIGGSIGVSLFGAIFSNRLATELASRLPGGGKGVPTAANPAVISQLPAEIHRPYVEGFSAALAPVFLAAAGISIAAFLLTWLLQEVPLRQTAAAEGVGESFASPREDSSERELERIIGTLLHKEGRLQVYEELIADSGIDIAPSESWVLARLGEREPMTAGQLAASLHASLDLLGPPLALLLRRGYVEQDDDVVSLTADGRDALDRLVACRQEHLRRLLDGWDTENDEHLCAALDRLARALTGEMPVEPAPAT